MKKKPNQLIHENSPYLLQHAYNPVDWRPWDDQTHEVARTQNKMLLVSIGYSSCHWCHVMEHESFEDFEVAEIMNRHFICVKVDREERPDVDHMFMEAVQLIGGRGGWPLNCFALPDGRPVFGGTYFQKAHWKSVLLQIADLWEQKSEDLFEQAEQLVETMKHMHTADSRLNNESNDVLLKKMAQQSKLGFDRQHGGSAGAPKFPMPGRLYFLLLMGHTGKDSELLDHVSLSLEKMAWGGIYDQLGGGFSRYSVDAAWHVPHFEKMLYDNAQLISLYAEAFRIYKNGLFANVVNESIDFIFNHMKGPEGAFYSALDADSEGVEGKYYVWTKAELDQLLGEDASLIRDYFGIERQAYWEDGLNIPVVPEDKIGFCNRHGLNISDFDSKLFTARQKLLAYREKRVPPGLDDKRLCSWNALMISALVNAYQTFGKVLWLEQAQHTTDFILKNMRQDDGGLFRSWKNHQAKIPAFLDDYSLMINALADLYQADGNEIHLRIADELTSYVFSNFYEEDAAVFSFTAKGQNDLAVRPLELYDNVIPSSNAAMCMALVKLGMLLENTTYLNTATQMIERQKPLMESHPSGFFHWAAALFLLDKQPMVVMRGPGAEQANIELRKKIPIGMLSAWATKDSAIPSVADKPLSTVLHYWFCDKNGCRLPVDSLQQLIKIFDEEA